MLLRGPPPPTNLSGVQLGVEKAAAESASRWYANSADVGGGGATPLLNALVARGT